MSSCPPEKSKARRHFPWLLLELAFVSGTACLYTGEITPPDPAGNGPSIDNYIPSEASVKLASDEDNVFQVFYSDPDDALIDLKVTWYINGLPRAEGPTLYVYPEDLGGASTGLLHVTVADPDGNTVFVVWNLSVDSAQ
jgi:hypothetical protein